MWRRVGARLKEWREALDFEGDFRQNRAKKNQLREELKLMEMLTKLKTEQTNQTIAESLAGLQEAMLLKGGDSLKTLEETRARLLADLPKAETVEQLRDRLKKMVLEEQAKAAQEQKRDKN